MSDTTKIHKFKSYPKVTAPTSTAALEAFPGSTGFHRKGLHLYNPDATNAVLVYIPDDLTAVPTVAGTDDKDYPDYKILAGGTLDIECSAQSRVFLGATGSAIAVIPKEIY
jgi:hypothetical protein